MTGYTFLITTYGLEAFSDALMWVGWVGATLYIPILPICLIYQLLYLFFFIKRKRAKHHIKQSYSDYLAKNPEQ